MDRRGFLQTTAAVSGAFATGCAAATAPPNASTVRPVTYSPDRFDPWIELDRNAWHHNVREVSRLAGGRPILAVIKNNAYGLGDRAVGPLVADFSEVGGIACVRPEEAFAMREEGVTKPIVVMAESSVDEMEALARQDVMPSVWLDDALPRIEEVSRRLGRPLRVQLFVDTGMNREGMPYRRARPWLQQICTSEFADVDATYTMFQHELDFDRVQLHRFNELIAWARSRNLPIGTLHAAPTVEVFHLPESHFDMVRPGNALFGNYPRGEGVREQAELKTVFSLKTRVVRLEQLQPSEAAGFYRSLEVDRATWVALLPIGRTDGYPSEANRTCEVLINGRLYPVEGGVNSAHAIVNIGPEKTVEVGDEVTLIGPDHVAITPHEVSERTGVGFLRMIQGMNPRLPRVIVGET